MSSTDPQAPWLDPLSVWKTKGAYFSWLRGNLRRVWMRSPVSIRFKNSRCRPAPKKSRGKWVGDCAICQKEFLKSHLVVDHIVPAGSLRHWDDVGDFVRRLLGPSSDELRLLCKPCHHVVTIAERAELDLEGARLRIEVLSFCRLPPARQKAILESLSCPPPLLRNQTLRRSAYESHLRHAQFPDPSPVVL
jgi:5-methylcytosine-specific restriction endonuclease McrA